MLINGCEIISVYADYDERISGYGNIYRTPKDVLRNHPNAKVMRGFCIKPPSGYKGDVPDWFDTYNDAFVYAATKI